MVYSEVFSTAYLAAVGEAKTMMIAVMTSHGIVYLPAAVQRLLIRPSATLLAAYHDNPILTGTQLWRRQRAVTCFSASTMLLNKSLILREPIF